MFPALSDKCVVCENFTNTEEIYNKLEMGSREYKQNVVTFSTVCRLGEEKGIERAVYVFGRLLSEGYKISNGLSLEMDLNEIILNKRLKSWIIQLY